MNPLTLILLFFAGLFLLGFITVKVGNYNAKKAKEECRFLIAYKNLQCILACRPVNDASYYEILEYLGQIQKYKYVNIEKLEVFKTEFKRRYDQVSKDILREEDEFSIDNSLGE